MTPTHRFEESDELRLIIEAESFGDLLCEAGRALGDRAAGFPADREPGAIEIVLEAPDPAALLVEWLNEIIGRAESEGWLAREFEWLELTPNRMRVRAQGSPWPSRSFPVKAATLDRARVTETPQGYRGEVTLDV